VYLSKFQVLDDSFESYGAGWEVEIKIVVCAYKKHSHREMESTLLCFLFKVRIGLPSNNG
jgi:hypothetical protein